MSTISPVRRCAPLTSAAHCDEELAVANIDDRDLSTVAGHGTIDFPVEQALDGRTNLGVGPLAGTGAQRALEDGAYSRKQLTTNHRPDRRLQPQPDRVALLAYGDHIAGDEHVCNARQLEQPLDER